MNFYLYKITNVIDGKNYIGQSINPASRWRRHKSDAKLGRKQSHLYRAIRKYGIENFEFIIIAEAKSIENIDYLEIACIMQYKSSDRHFGYNFAEGGNGKRLVSKETREKISKLNLGKKYSQEVKDKKSISMQGKNSGSKNGMFGRRGPLAKLSMTDAQNIRIEKASGTSSLKLCVKYNVSKKTILNIIHNKIYKE